MKKGPLPRGEAALSFGKWWGRETGKTDPTFMLETGMRRDHGDREAARLFSRLPLVQLFKHEMCQF
ncbi:MAG: hypothetical protein ABT10_22285 [Novosphingobium sp. SCN 63-17]|nr:MAG: hypothetical protein ABT10_22285 [Novosphingobium sp. SCN 63-17]OJX95075.1 MAG: hypothetical protein BGP00_09360 [Novosphingobium sp. 63-713]